MAEFKVTVDKFVSAMQVAGRIDRTEGEAFQRAVYCFIAEAPEEFGPVERTADDWEMELEAWRTVVSVIEGIELVRKKDRRTDPDVARDIDPVRIPLRND